MIKRGIYFFYCCSFSLLGMAQQKNTSLHILYVPGVSDLYIRSYDMENLANKKVELSSFENYISYQPVAQNTQPASDKGALVYHYDFDFSADRPALYYLLINTNDKYAGLGYEYPVRRVWLGPGSQQIDMYSVVENEKDITGEYAYMQQNKYRFYYEGVYEKENKFLQQLFLSSVDIGKKYLLMIEGRYKNYNDTSYADTQQRIIELANKFAGSRTDLFNYIDSITAQLYFTYKKYFPKPTADFDKVMQPELASLANSLKMGYCTYFLSAFNGIQTTLKNEVIGIAVSIRKEMDVLPLQLSCETYRNTYFSYVYAMRWKNTADTLSDAFANNEFYTKTSNLITEQFGDRPQLAEYLHASTVSFMINYMSYDGTLTARNGFESFQKLYPSSLYRTTLDNDFTKKEGKFNKEKNENTAIQSTDTVTSPVTPAPYADTTTAEMGNIGVMAFTPPRHPNDIKGVAVKYWNLNLYTANNKAVRLKTLKGKKIAIKAVAGLPESRDLAYFQYLERKFPSVAFVYIFDKVPDPSMSKLFQSFKLKGQCLFMKNSSDDNSTYDLWNQYIYYPYWQLINSNNLVQHIYENDKVENLIGLWINNQPLTD